MMRCATFIVAVAAALALTPSHAVVTATRAELSADAGQTSLTMEFPSRVRHRVRTQTHPARIVIDLEKTDQASVAELFNAQRLVPGVRAIRVTAPLTGTTRVVLELDASPARLRTSVGATSNKKQRIQLRWDMPLAQARGDSPAVAGAGQAATAVAEAPKVAQAPPSPALPAAAAAVGDPARAQANVSGAPAPAVRPGPAPRAGRPDRSAASGKPAPDWLLLDVSINGQRLKDVVRAEQLPGGGALLLPTDAWTEARLNPLAAVAAMSDGTPAFALGAIAGATYRLDRQTLSLDINAPAAAFAGSSLGQQDGAIAPPPRPPPGVMLNYDLSLSRGAGGSFNGATLEAVAFSQFGHFVSSHLLSDADHMRSATRLNTYWSYALPHRMETLVVGDTVGVAGGWSRPARYAGLRWGRDFGMRPGFVTLPQVALRGEAALPSTVEVLVNNARRLSQRVEPGPFDLSNVPIVSGAGEIDLVVRDLLGRETVVRQSYYASPQLLAPGLSDFSFEAGRLRTGFGTDSSYGDAFGAATWRQGLSASLTGEARLELQPGRRAGGAELAGLLGTWAVARVAAAAASGDRQGVHESGHLFKAGIERSTARGGATLQYEYASRKFAPFGEGLGPATVNQRARDRWLVSLGGSLWAAVSGGASIVSQTRWDGERVKLLGLSLSLPLAHDASMTLSANKRLDRDQSWSAALTASFPLGDGINTTTRVDRGADGKFSAAASAARNAPAGTGLGWRAQAATTPGQRAQLGLQYNTDRAEWALDATASADAQVSTRVGNRGTVGWFEGVVFASRPVGEGSMAVVRVDGIEGVPIMRSHQTVTKTDARGLAFVPGLLPWQTNLIAIDPVDLPLDVDMSSTIKEVVPYARSGVVVDFVVRRTRQALVLMHQRDGTPVPLGAKVRLLPSGPEFITGRRGEVWLTDLAEHRQRLQVDWPQGGCTLEITVVASADGTPGRIGPMTCEGAQP